jgi:hypothetical protein
MESLQATFEMRRSGTTTVRLTGALDEHSDLDALLPSIAPGRLVVHLGNIEQLNEAGMRAWVAWLATLDARNVKVDLVACSQQLVEAFNADAQLARCARVKSVQVMYRCAKCKRDDLFVVSIAEIQKFDGAPHRACETCIGRLAMVDDPNRYFEFVGQLPRRGTPSIDLTAVLAAGSSSQVARGSKLKIPTQPMLPLRPSAWETLQTVMAKTAVPPTTTTDRKYLIVLVVVLALIAFGLALALVL